jgi:starvation-inducible DNA-binding protein
MRISIGTETIHRQTLADQLSKILADEYVIYTKTRNAHYNVTSSKLYDKHKFFEVQFRQLDELIDKVAERIRIIGHFAPASLKKYLELTQLSEMMHEKKDGIGYIKELLMDHESIIIELRKNIKSFAINFENVGTSDFIDGIIKEHEKMAWFHRAHLQKI